MKHQLQMAVVVRCTRVVKKVHFEIKIEFPKNSDNDMKREGNTT